MFELFNWLADTTMTCGVWPVACGLWRMGEVTPAASLPLGVRLDSSPLGYLLSGGIQKAEAARNICKLQRVCVTTKRYSARASKS